MKYGSYKHSTYLRFTSTMHRFKKNTRIIQKFKAYFNHSLFNKEQQEQIFSNSTSTKYSRKSFSHSTFKGPNCPPLGRDRWVDGREVTTAADECMRDEEKLRTLGGCKTLKFKLVKRRKNSPKGFESK
jgi:hypothetical protein